MAASFPILASLAPRKVAVVFPAVPEEFWPRSPLWTELTEDLRGPRVDVFGFMLPFGLVSENALLGYPELFGEAYDPAERSVVREAALRTRTWLDGDGSLPYLRIVVLSWGPLKDGQKRNQPMPAWSKAVAGAKNAQRVQLVAVPLRNGLRGSVVRERLVGAVRGALR